MTLRTERLVDAAMVQMVPKPVDGGPGQSSSSTPTASSAARYEGFSRHCDG